MNYIECVSISNYCRYNKNIEHLNQKNKTKNINH